MIKRRARTATQTKPSNVSHLKTIGEHLVELRTRLVIVSLFFLVASSLAYVVRDQLIGIVLAPIGHEKLIYLTPGGGFTFIFQIAIYTGLLLTAPLVTYQLYKFIAPALSQDTRKGTFRLLVSSTLLMIAGASFGYFVAIPGALRFLTEFASDYISTSLTADSYLNFVAAYVLGLGLMFQLPLLLILWNRVFPIKPGGLWKSQRFVIVGAFIAAAIITPTPDGVNQTLIALPIILMYQLGVIAVWSSNRKRKKTTALETVEPVRKIVQPAVEIKVPVPLEPVVKPVVIASKSPVQPQTVRRPRPVAVDGFNYARQVNYERPQPVRKLNRPPAQRPVSARQSIDGIIA